MSKATKKDVEAIMEHELDKVAKSIPKVCEINEQEAAFCLQAFDAMLQASQNRMSLAGSVAQMQAKFAQAFKKD